MLFLNATVRDGRMAPAPRHVVNVLLAEDASGNGNIWKQKTR
jgi:hypothetical protein